MQQRFLFSVAAGACVLGLAAPGGAQSSTAPRTITVAQPVPLAVEMYRLANGLTVILSRDTSVPVVAVNLWYRVGSGDERPGRSGFAHLFEHMMFGGSQNVTEHPRLVTEAGGTLNAGTTSDHTSYFEVVPSNFLERVLWLEADRMGFLAGALTQEKLENQRSVVQNERRQNFENVPFGLVGETIGRLIYPAGHPYSWPTIGSLADLNAASLDDVSAFFRQYYTPNNASLAVVGDFHPAQAKRWIERYFGTIPAGAPVERPAPPPVRLTREVRHVMRDRVQLPRLYVVWPTPRRFEPGHAELALLGYVLAGDRSSRLHQRLVLRDQLAEFVSAGQNGRALAGQFSITVQARPGVDLDRLLAIVDEEVARLRTEGPGEREVARARNNLQALFVQRTESALGLANELNGYAMFTGDPAFIQQDYARYDAATTGSVKQALDWLGAGRLILSVVPQEQTQLQRSQ
ncbi:MAG TPA: pitrilysin family protein [Longimicrobium sp.]|jgi:zinc protease